MCICSDNHNEKAQSDGIQLRINIQGWAKVVGK